MGIAPQARSGSGTVYTPTPAGQWKKEMMEKACIVFEGKRASQAGSQVRGHLS